MKVLIETITSRRGYKNFADKTELDNFLAQNHNKITDYQILQEDDVVVIRSDFALTINPIDITTLVNQHLQHG